MLDMLEMVLETECADRGISHLGQTARYLEICLQHAFALGIQDRRQLQVFIRNLAQNEMDIAEVLRDGPKTRIPTRIMLLPPKTFLSLVRPK